VSGLYEVVKESEVPSRVRAAAAIAQREAQAELGIFTVPDIQWIRPAQARVPAGRERASVHFCFEDVLPDQMFRGMASVVGVRVDSDPVTIFERGAFAESLARPKREIKLLWQHDET
jgi:hypothetical protein